MPKIYTKTGDKGETSLFGGTRLPKYHLRIESYGTVDELNAVVGLVLDHLPAAAGGQKGILQTVQLRLFTIGSSLAADPDKMVITPDVLPEDIKLLETAIDEMNEVLEPLKHFILPGGAPAISYCHLARTVCRRAERRVIALAADETVDEAIYQYLNRLSDYFFVLGRLVAQALEVDEVKWVPRK